MINSKDLLIICEVYDLGENLTEFSFIEGRLVGERVVLTRPKRLERSSNPGKYAFV